MLHEEKLWARVNDECRPVSIEGKETRKLDVTTCVEGETTCGVTVRWGEEGTTAHQWCERGGSVGGPVYGDRLLLVAADDDHAAYTRVVWLDLVPVSPRGELQRCTGKRLRENERRGDLFPMPPVPASDLLEPPAPVIVMGSRYVRVGAPYGAAPAMYSDHEW